MLLVVVPLLSEMHYSSPQRSSAPGRFRVTDSFPLDCIKAISRDPYAEAAWFLGIYEQSVSIGISVLC